MKADDGTGQPKIAAAKAALTTLVDELPSCTTRRSACASTARRSAGPARRRAVRTPSSSRRPAPLARSGLKASMNAITPRRASRGSGPSPAGRGEGPRKLRSRRRSCSSLLPAGASPAPCGVARALAKGGVALIPPVGFEVASSARNQLQCIADAGGGPHVDADNAHSSAASCARCARAPRPYMTQGAALHRPRAGRGRVSTARASTRRPSRSRSRPGTRSALGAGQTHRRQRDAPELDAGIPSVFKTGRQDERLEFTDSDAATNSDDVLTAIVQAPVEENDLRDPPVGRFFYKLEVDPAPGQSGPFPVELFVRVTGKVIGAPVASSDSTAGSGAVDTFGGGDDGPSDIVLLAGALGGIVAGLLAGGALAGWRRRPA